MGAGKAGNSGKTEGNNKKIKYPGNNPEKSSRKGYE